MSASRPLEMDYLSQVEKKIDKCIALFKSTDPFELRLQILEAVASRIGGFDLSCFHSTFGIEHLLPTEQLLDIAEPVASALAHLPIPPALSLSALARETLHESERKVTGAYHTDFRLATRLAQLAATNLTHESKVIDPACGAGILLASLTYAVCGMDRKKITHWFTHGVCAADLSKNSLRATLLTLASFTDDIDALKAMKYRWFCGDSLIADQSVWQKMSSNGFDAVIGNPPWEKIKTSRHEFLKSNGSRRNYGESIESLDEDRYQAERFEVSNYSRQLMARYPSLSNGEPDLYIAFSELFFELCKENGVVAALVPGGLIRSQGTTSIRQKIFDTSHSISISVIDNRARFFAIDSRFKFLAVMFTKSGTKKTKKEPIQLLHERGTPTSLEITGSTSIGRTALASIRKDLSLPEVKSLSEWRLYSKIAGAGIEWDNPDNGWRPKFCREVDMTKERSKFLSVQTPDALPVIEGRMVQSHRFGVKGYVSGSGRSAVWERHGIGNSNLSPQFWIHTSNIPKNNHLRISSLRIGFCDIAGQTNERSLMASLIPSGVVCGNKVPTILFPEDTSEERLYVWVSIANSFVFDWMLRRVLTTTVNYFLLQSIPMPKIAKDGLPWKKLVKAASELRTLDTAGNTKENYDRIMQIRAEIDAEVAISYGLSLKDMELILNDFTILDRGQPPLLGEAKSTITRDIVLSTFAKRTSDNHLQWSDRVAIARKLGAIAYVPSEIVQSIDDLDTNGVKTNG